jgi:hypothetical protein
MELLEILEKKAKENNKDFAAIIEFCNEYFLANKIIKLHEEASDVFCENPEKLARKLAQKLYNSKLTYYGAHINPSVAIRCEKISYILRVGILDMFVFWNASAYFKYFYKKKLVLSPKYYLIDVYKNIYNIANIKNIKENIALVKQINLSEKEINFSSSISGAGSNKKSSLLKRKDIIWIGSRALKAYFPKNKENLYMFEDVYEIIADSTIAAEFCGKKEHIFILKDFTLYRWVCKIGQATVIIYNSADYELLTYFNYKNRKIASYYIMLRFLLISALFYRIAGNKNESYKKLFIHNKMSELTLPIEILMPENYYGTYIDAAKLTVIECGRNYSLYKPLLK